MEICSACESIIFGEPSYCVDCDALHCSNCVTPITDEMTVRFAEENLVR